MHCLQSMLGVLKLLGGILCCLSCELSLHPVVISYWQRSAGVGSVLPAQTELQMPCMPDVLAALHAVR